MLLTIRCGSFSKSIVDFMLEAFFFLVISGSDWEFGDTDKTCLCFGNIGSKPAGKSFRCGGNNSAVSLIPETPTNVISISEKFRFIVGDS